jgi:tyrosinase
MSSEQFTYRERIQSMPPDDLQNLRRAYSQMMTIGDNRGYNYWAGIHGVPQWYCWHAQRRVGSDLSLRLFLPWHRAYLYMFEQAVKDIISDVYIPWWDWRFEHSQGEGVPRAFAEETIDGQPNPLAKAHISAPATQRTPATDRETRRFPGDPSELPTSDRVNFALSLSDFGDFSDEIESIHDQIHGWTGGIAPGSEFPPVFGDMAQVPFAAWDPLFWSHHCMIDRLWWLWQLRHGINNIPTELLDQELAPFPFTVRRVLNVHELGYDYAGIIMTVGGTSR